MILALAAASAAMLAALFAFLGWRAAGGPAAVHPELYARLHALETQVERTPGALRDEVRALREELRATLGAQDGAQDTRFRNLSGLIDQRLAGFGQTQADQIKGLREETTAGHARFDAAQRLGLERVSAELKGLSAAHAAGQTGLRDRLTAELDKLRAENGDKLEQMRATVDEKLQSTLDQRLDANFKQVRDNLESVQKGLGEMQALAAGVGDLKRVLTNVKARGTWGEVQLGALLEDILDRGQYAEQVRIRPRSGETVDFAVRLPGQDEAGQVWLPIDCKFPHEDYARLVAAQDAGEPALVEAAGKALERAVALQAKSIGEKYIHPPASTDFAYMYLPTEGLFAEMVRRQGFAAELRSRYRVEIAGPSTLTALLNSLRVGFKSLQIQKKSSEVWVELGRVKGAFEKYGDALEAVDKKLDEAKSKVADVGRRHRDIVHRLRNVDAPELLEARSEPVGLPAPEADAEQAA